MSSRNRIYFFKKSKLRKSGSEKQIGIGIPQAILTNRIKEMEDKFSEIQDKMEEMVTSLKENAKIQILTHYIQEIRHTMERKNICIRIIRTEFRSRAQKIFSAQT